MHHMINSLSNIKGKYKRVELLEKLRLHRDLHVIDYATALEVYRKEVLKQVTAMLASAEKQDFNQFNERVTLSAPINVEEGYSKLIMVFEHMTNDLIELEFDEATKLLTDTWDWAVSAKMTNMLYNSVGAAR